MTSKKPTYPERLLEIGIRLLEPYTTAKAHTKMQCVTCQHEWTATPISKLQNFRLHGAGGCPICTHERRYGEVQAANKASLPAHIVPDSSWDGNRNFTRGKVWFHNTKCGHRFETYPNYVLAGNTECTICGDAQRVADLNLRSEATRMYDDPEAWADYRSLVTKFTNRTYREHKNAINPNNWTRSRYTGEGTYQLDHIVPLAIGFQRKIPPEEISRLENLQMLPRIENTRKGAKLVVIPQILASYFPDLTEFLDDGVDQPVEVEDDV